MCWCLFCFCWYTCNNMLGRSLEDERTSTTTLHVRAQIRSEQISEQAQPFWEVQLHLPVHLVTVQLHRSLLVRNQHQTTDLPILSPNCIGDAYILESWNMLGPTKIWWRHSTSQKASNLHAHARAHARAISSPVPVQASTSRVQPHFSAF